MRVDGAPRAPIKVSEGNSNAGVIRNGEGDLDITEIDITESAITNFQEIDITESDITEKGT